jgi:biopolymer transport protein ExbD
LNIPSPRPVKKARIEIIPLIDIIFFLLATFVMVSLSMVKNEGIGVDLPVATTASPQERTDYTAITVTEAGTFHFNKEEVDLEGLVTRLKALKAEQSDPKVFINGDQKAEFGKAVTVLDEVRKLGIAKVSIETRGR